MNEELIASAIEAQAIAEGAQKTAEQTMAKLGSNTTLQAMAADSNANEALGNVLRDLDAYLESVGPVIRAKEAELEAMRRTKAAYANGKTRILAARRAAGRA